MQFPKLTKVRQRLDTRRTDRLEEHVRRELEQAHLSLPHGASLAIAVGSRGIANLSTIVKETVLWARSRGYRPFVVPAMGSHGGATAEGQRAVLESYGVAEQTVGAEIVSSLEVVKLPRGGLTHDVYWDKHAYGAEGTIVINRIKPHTDFHGAFESGLLKMCVIGLGKHAQALEIHSRGVQGLRELIVPTARHVLLHANVVLGLAIVENGCEQTAIVKAIPPGDFEREEPNLLEEARRMMPSLPCERIDVLIVDEFGKDVSGVGIDTTVIGRVRVPGAPEPDTPRISAIVLADLTEASHGNALGMGLADVITERVRSKIDFRATYENVVTSSFLERGRMPIVARTCAEAIAWALRGCGVSRTDEARIVRIVNTRRLDTVGVSPVLVPELRDRPGIEVLSDEVDVVDEQGGLPSF